MRALLQRVKRAAVNVDGQTVGEINHGLLVFLAVADGDTAADALWLLQKVAKQRLFSDDQGRMNLDCAAVAGSFLVVSQFTLLATTVKGNRPGFPHGAETSIAKQVYEDFCRDLAELSGCPVARGQFAAHMEVSLLNDGPVTILLDTKLRE